MGQYYTLLTTVPSEYQSNAMNGSIFEAIITTAFVKEGITPLYTQTYLEFVPNVKYDCTGYYG